eukprot:5424396-Prymnesium_polylepis.1
MDWKLSDDAICGIFIWCNYETLCAVKLAGNPRLTNMARRTIRSKRWLVLGTNYPAVQAALWALASVELPRSRLYGTPRQDRHSVSLAHPRRLAPNNSAGDFLVSRWGGVAVVEEPREQRIDFARSGVSMDEDMVQERDEEVRIITASNGGAGGRGRLGCWQQDAARKWRQVQRSIQLEARVCSCTHMGMALNGTYRPFVLAGLTNGQLVGWIHAQFRDPNYVTDYDNSPLLREWYAFEKGLPVVAIASGPDASSDGTMAVLGCNDGTIGLITIGTLNVTPWGMCVLANRRYASVPGKSERRPISCVSVFGPRYNGDTAQALSGNCDGVVALWDHRRKLAVAVICDSGENVIAVGGQDTLALVCQGRELK